MDSLSVIQPPMAASSPLTIPLLLLGLYLALLVVGIVLVSWSGHLHPAPGDALRVTHAVERAGMGHLVAPAKLAGAVLGGFSVLSGFSATLSEGSALWSTIAPLLCPLLIAPCLYYCSRKTLSTCGQLVGTRGCDARMTLASRSIVGIILCCEATVGLVLLGLHTVASTALGIEQAGHLVLITSSSIGLVILVFGRAASAAVISATAGALNAAQPHAASLAVLVARTFHAPLLRLLSLVALSTLGHSALLLLTNGQEGVPVNNFWLYPHLLKLLGLFCLFFAALVVRSSERENSSLPWLRGAAVHLALTIAGAWSLSSELPEAWTLSIPAGLTFFYLSLALCIWASRPFKKSEPELGLVTLALSRIPALLGFLVLLMSLVIFAKGTALPLQALFRLLLGASFALIPLGILWLLARELSDGSEKAGELSMGGAPLPSFQKLSPSKRLLGFLPFITFAVTTSALASRPLLIEDSKSSHLFLQSLGATIGSLLLLSLAGHTERSCQKSISSIRELLANRDEAAGSSATALNFETAIVMCRKAIESGDLYGLLLMVAPVLLMFAASSFAPPSAVVALSLGLGLGTILVGVGSEALLGDTRKASQRSLGTLSLLACTVQVIWLLSVGILPL